MDDMTNASNALALCYPLTCISEECASSLVTTQKRREEIYPQTLPSQEESISGLSAQALRPYQAQAVQALRSALAGGAVRLMLYSPTGSGKTEIAMTIIRCARDKGKRVAFLVNRVHLVEQTSRRFAKSGIDHGVIQADNTAREYENILVASIQTVAKRGLPEDIDLFIIDEAHAVAGSKDYRAVIAASKGRSVIGLSATPFARGLGKHYDELRGALFQQMVIAATIPELIANGYLVDCDVYAPSEPDMAGIRQFRNAFGEMDYSDADVGRAVDKPELVGDLVMHHNRLARGAPTVCFAASIAHSQHIVRQFNAAGVPAEHIDCHTSPEERQAILRRLETGATTVVSNVAVLAEGWDFPACKALILARPTRSLTRYIQMAGRVLRPHATKERALILDHSGTVTRLGFPTDEFPLELDDGSPRKQAVRKENEQPLPKACPSCAYVKPARMHKCPVCGFAPEQQPGIEVREGELVLVKPKKPAIGKQQLYSELLWIADEKGHQPGWAAHMYREYFGVWPCGLERVAAPPTDEGKGIIKHLAIRRANASKAKGAPHAGA